MTPVLYIARRLTLRGGRDNRRSPSVWIAAVSVALTVSVLLLTLAVVGGFREGIVGKVRGLQPDLYVMPAYSYETGEIAPYIAKTDSLSALIASALPQEARMSLKMQYPVVLKTADNFSALVLNAFDAEHDYAFEHSNIKEGKLPDFVAGEGDNSLVLPTTVARTLGIGVGDKVDCYFFVNGNIKARKPEVSALYESGFGENDRTMAYASLRWLQKVAGIDSLYGTAVDVRGLKDVAEAPVVAEHLQTVLLDAVAMGTISDVYPVDNVQHRASVYFSWLDLLDTNVVVIFILMACVAGFTLIASLFILILENVQAIGVLRAMGMTVGRVRDVFVFLALRYVLAGLLAGNAIGLGIIFVQKQWQFMPLNPEMYYLSAVPVSIDVSDIVWLNLAVVAVAWAVMILPARLVATVRPAQTMQYE